MTEKLRQFFSPQVLVYQYAMPEQELIAKINSLFQTQYKLSNNLGLNGNFHSNGTFELFVSGVSFGSFSFFKSTLQGKIIPINDTLTEVHLRPKPSFLYYFFFFVPVLHSLLFFCFNGISFSKFFSTLPALVIIPLLCVHVAGIALYAIQERWERGIGLDSVEIEWTYCVKRT